VEVRNSCVKKYVAKLLIAEIMNVKKFVMRVHANLAKKFLQK